MRILVTGAQGMLGKAVCRVLGGKHELVATGREDLDVTDPVAVRGQILRVRPDWVFHLAALTDVDLCERQPERAARVNALSSRYLNEVCSAQDVGLLLLSSIAVFDGDKQTPYTESDTPAPINAYGRSKLQAELAVRDTPRHLIVRSGWLFGGGAEDKKFVRKILDLAASQPVIYAVSDKVGSPTYVDDLAGALARLVKDERVGVVHLVNTGPPVSRYALAQAIVKAAGFPTEVRPVNSDYFPGLAPRPNMEAASSERVSGWLPGWEQSLREYVSTLIPVSPTVP